MREAQYKYVDPFDPQHGTSREHKIIYLPPKGYVTRLIFLQDCVDSVLLKDWVINPEKDNDIMWALYKKRFEEI